MTIKLVELRAKSFEQRILSQCTPPKGIVVSALEQPQVHGVKSASAAMTAAEGAFQQYVPFLSPEDVECSSVVPPLDVLSIVQTFHQCQ